MVTSYRFFLRQPVEMVRAWHLVAAPWVTNTLSIYEK